MPYEYRKLSLSERDQLVEFRRQQGYPLHSPPHPFREAGTYLITAANFEHARIMASSERRTEFEKQLIDELRGCNGEIIAWVILANHYHVLITVESLESVSEVIQHIHGSTSREWNLQDGLTGKRKVWYRFSDRLMRNETHLNQALNYIHHNPIKHGYVEDVYDWPWSSLLLYVDEKGSEWLKENWRKYAPPDDFGGDWGFLTAKVVTTVDENLRLRLQPARILHRANPGRAAGCLAFTGLEP